MASGDAYDIFISYARGDGDGAAELNGWLREKGFCTFFDRSALRAGLRWVPALEDAIGRSKAVAILVGKHGIGNTQQYERELALIRQTGDAAFPVIPVLMPGCDSPPTGFLQEPACASFRHGLMAALAAARTSLGVPQDCWFDAALSGAQLFKARAPGFSSLSYARARVPALLERRGVFPL